MVIYQVLDEQNNPIGEFLNFDKAQHQAEELTVWDADHYYHVEKLVFNEAQRH